MYGKIQILLYAIFALGLGNGSYSSQVSDFEIRTLTGEPNYKSVNLTWEIENTSELNINESNTPAITLLENDNEFPKVFQIFYCEIQSFGPHRCRSKIVEDNTIEEDSEDLIKHYSTVIDNLRMATKYSFHVKPQVKRKLQHKNQRGMAKINDNEVQTESMFNGETIIIPTKGFSAVATKCLPHASEIEVETGPYFGGKIVVDGGNCGIKGNPKESTDKYIMIIDHEKCGSLVKPETNTVETFITVQENLGIFTHSTRRFVVVCSFQSGMQTVRASFTVPGKGGIASVEENDPFEPDRNGRSRQFKFVDRSGLVLKDNLNEDESVEIPKEETNNNGDAENSVATIENIIPGINENEIKNNIIINDSLQIELDSEQMIDNEQQDNKHNKRHAKYSRLIGEKFSSTNDRSQKHDKSGYYSNNYTTGVVIAVSLSVIMIGVFIYVIKREFRRQNTTAASTRLRKIEGIQKQQIVVIKNY